MHAHAEKVLRAGLLVETHQMIRVPFLCFPDIHQVLVADLGGMAIRFAVVQVLRLALDVHVARVPVAVFNRRLRSPVRPDAELGIAKPVRNLVGLQRFPGWQERSALRRLLRTGKSSKKPARNTRHPTIEALPGDSFSLGPFQSVRSASVFGIRAG